MAIERINDVEVALERMEEGQPYVDVRTEMEFEAGHPTDSYNIPFAIHHPETMQNDVPSCVMQ